MRKVYEDTCCKGSKRTKDEKHLNGKTKGRASFKSSKLRKSEKNSTTDKSEIVTKEEIVDDGVEIKVEQQESRIKSENQNESKEEELEKNETTPKKKLKIEDIKNITKVEIGGSDAKEVMHERI